MLNATQPGPSSLLISEPFMLDPNFKRSVVLLTEHNEDGTLGYVLNQKSDVQVKDVLEDCPEADFDIYIGGPVGNDTLHFIHQCYDRMNSGELIKDGVYWGGNFETLKLLLNKGLIGKNEIRFFAGYSGWSPGQLDQEITQNSWLVTDSYRAGLLFPDHETNLWEEVVTGLGNRFAHIARFPENPMWN